MVNDLGEPWVPYARWHVTRYVKAPIGTERYDVFTHDSEDWVVLSNQDGQGGVAAAPRTEVVYPFEGRIAYTQGGDD